MISKGIRQRTIFEVIRQEVVPNQQQLQKKLRQSGIVVTQATLSRDIKELGLVKGPRGYQEPQTGGQSASEEHLDHLLREFLEDIQTSGNLVLLKTQPGCAQTVAVALDRVHWKELAGTLAGDDTILMVIAEGYRSAEVKRRIQKIVS